MTVLAAEEFQEATKALEQNANLYPTLKQVVEVLGKLRPEALESDERIQKLRHTKEDIYLFRLGGLTFYLTKNAENVIMLGVSAG